MLMHVLLFGVAVVGPTIAPMVPVFSTYKCCCYFHFSCSYVASLVHQQMPLLFVCAGQPVSLSGAARAGRKVDIHSIYPVINIHEITAAAAIIEPQATGDECRDSQPCMCRVCSGIRSSTGGVLRQCSPGRSLVPMCLAAVCYHTRQPPMDMGGCMKEWVREGVWRNG